MSTVFAINSKLYFIALIWFSSTHAINLFEKNYFNEIQCSLFSLEKTLLSVGIKNVITFFYSCPQFYTHIIWLMKKWVKKDKPKLNKKKTIILCSTTWRKQYFMWILITFIINWYNAIVHWFIEWSDDNDNNNFNVEKPNQIESIYAKPNQHSHKLLFMVDIINERHVCLHRCDFALAHICFRPLESYTAVSTLIQYVNFFFIFRLPTHMYKDISIIN